MSEATPIYKVIFLNQNKVYELYAKAIYQSEMYGFVEIENYMFDQNSQIVVDPSEEKLKAEFKGVNRSYIPVNCIMRIDEVDKRGNAKIKQNKNGNITSLKSTIFDGNLPKKE